MKYLLDTNVCIRYLNGQSEGIRQRLGDRNPEQIVLPTGPKSPSLVFLSGQVLMQ